MRRTASARLSATQSGWIPSRFELLDLLGPVAGDHEDRAGPDVFRQQDVSPVIPDDIGTRDVDAELLSAAPETIPGAGFRQSHSRR